jgi:hypothetical protein
MVTDFVEKVEFQARGSPHIHAEYWVKDAPKLEEDTDAEITAFIDNYITAHTSPGRWQ